jgi:serine/threonine protein kinase
MTSAVVCCHLSLSLILKGAAAWMAPEVWTSGKYDQKADVYSFAIICWELCTFSDPCCGMVPDIYASKVALEGLRPPMNDGVNSDWRMLIQACWAQDPRQRPEFSQISFEISK